MPLGADMLRACRVELGCLQFLSSWQAGRKQLGKAKRVHSTTVMMSCLIAGLDCSHVYSWLSGQSFDTYACFGYQPYVLQ